jgi:hypothetical protein
MKSFRTELLPEWINALLCDSKIFMVAESLTVSAAQQ